MGECLLCKTVQPLNQSQLCEYCSPDTCVNCPVDSVSFVDGVFKCSHGCEYDLIDYITRKIYTTILNGNWKEKLALAGDKVEYIFPDADAITVHAETPTSHSDDTVLATHYTPNKNELVENGFDESLQRENNKQYYEGTVRETAAYGWPYEPQYTEEQMEWATEYVVFEVPKSKTYVSSYRFLNFVQESGEFSIPTAKYDESVTFTPEQLYTVCSELGRPTDICHLFEF